MRMWQAYKSKKYLLRIFLSMTVLMVAVLFGSSLVLQINAERSAVRMQQQANRKVMSQIQFNISYMTGVLNNLAVSLYMDPNIVPLLTLRAPDEMSVIRSMNTLKQAYLSSSFLHSILVYNGFDNRIYSVGEMSLNKPDYAMAEEITKLLKKKEKLPRMELIPMNFSGKEQAVDFFSLVIYQNFDAMNTRNEGALVVNIKPEWLYENLRSVNDFAMPDQSGIYIMDGDGNIMLSDNPQLLPNRAEMKRALNLHKDLDAKPFGSFSSKLGGSTKQLVNYLNMEDSDWKVISVQPYNIVLDHIQEMRSTSIFVIVSILLLAVALSIILAHKLYKPIEGLLRQIGLKLEGETAGSTAARDELSAVASVYGAMVQKLRLASNEQDKQRHIIKNYYLRTLISNSPSLTAIELAENIKQNDLQINRAGPFQVVLIKIDGYSDFIRHTNHNERMLYYFAISNIAEEIMLPSLFRCEVVDMRTDHLVMLISLVNASKEDNEQLLKLLGNIQKVIHSYYQLSLTMTISEPCDSYEAITERYSTTIQYSMYKLLFGHQAMITADRIRMNRQHVEYSFPEELEKRLIESIRANNLSEMWSTLSQTLSRLSLYQYDHIIHGMLHIVDIIKATVRDIDKNRVVPLQMDLSSLSHQVLEKETVEEIDSLLRDVCQDIHDKLNRLENDKNTALMDTIKEIIEVNYKDRNLCLQGIAAMLHMTPAYIGRMFKQSEYLSVSEYLNEIRLKHAQTYLETKNLSIKEIMELVGYVNESTFFKLFKKMFGVTPKEYRLKKRLEY